MNKTIKYPFLLFSFFIILGSSFFCQEEKSLKELCSDKKISPAKLTIKIYKQERLLEVHHQKEVLKVYPCVLGFNPIGDKEMEGDGKTPEGTYKIRSLYPHHSWSYFIWIDYPNATSRQRFNERKRTGKIPTTATIGGEVGIHGVPEGSDDLIHLKTDWTLGCISLKTKDITDLFHGISKETMIEIHKSK